MFTGLSRARLDPPSLTTVTARKARLVAAFCSALALALAVSPSAALATGTLDQQQTQADIQGGPESISGPSAGNRSQAQTFTARLSGTLVQVDLFLVNATANDPSSLTVEIRSVVSGAPGPSVLASASVSVASVPFQPAFVAFAFASPPTVVAGTQYAIVAYATSDTYGWYRAGGDVYTGGSAFGSPASPPSTWSAAAFDFAFKTYVDRSPVCSAVSATPGVLKADERMQPVTLAGATDPNGDPLTYTINAVTQDEPTSGGWKQDTKTPDAVGVSANAVSLRGERNPSLNGRVYRIAFTVSDGSQSCSGVAKVSVEAKKGITAVDDGNQASWNSFTGALVP